MDKKFTPSYIKLFESGELVKRVRLLNHKLKSCTVCPRHCGINRLADERKFCRSGRKAIVCSYCDHHGEEPPLSGTYGSGTIFFGHCNLRCVFCQNSDISQAIEHPADYEINVTHLARIMLHLQDVRKCHNINLVSPGHFVPQIVEAVYHAIPLGLHLPLVYNSNGYDDPDTLKMLDGIIDIYMPDFKYFDKAKAAKYSCVHNYPETARQAIKEMFRQVGLLQTDAKGIARKGLIIRHLVLPNQLSDSKEILRWISTQLSSEVTLSLMAQYYPAHHAPRIPLLSRPLTENEYANILEVLYDLNFSNALYQELTSSSHYRPRFFAENHPFE